jgi:hypothetical protein
VEYYVRITDYFVYRRSLSMNFADIIAALEQALPILAGLGGHPELGILGQKLIDIAEAEIKRRQQQSGMTRAEILADAAATFQKAREENERLKKLGHE